MQQRLRIWVQAAFTVLTNGYISGFAQGKIYQGGLKQFCVPGLNCYSCPGALFSCPLGSLQAMFASRAGQFSFYVIGFLFAVGAFFGRFICGWLCPFGLFQDLLYKLKTKKLRRVPGDKYLRYMKYAVLALFVIILPLAVRNAADMGDTWFCKWICPSGTLMGGLPLVLMNEGLRGAAGWLFAWKVFLLAAISGAAVVIHRPFCKYLCPLGAFYGLLNPISIHRLRFSSHRCISCGKCAQACPMGVAMPQGCASPECIRCGACVKACPAGALSLGFGGVKPAKETEQRG